MNVPFGGALTGVAALPPGSQRDLVDPFAEKKSPWPKVIVIVILPVPAGVAPPAKARFDAIRSTAAENPARKMGSAMN